MSYERHIVRKGDYLLIRYTGALSASDLPGDQNIFQNIAALCRDYGCERVLLDARELAVDLGAWDLHQLGSFVSEVPDKAIKFAMLGTQDQVPADKFIENVATNRGGRLRVFTEEDEAVAWLSGT
jgi:hypothetical protein